MKKIRWFLGIFNYGSTWLGLFRIGLSVWCASYIPAILRQDGPVFLQVSYIAILAVTAVFLLLIGFSNLKEGFTHLKHRDAERLVYRE